MKGGDTAAPPPCPKGNVFAWDPLRTVDLVATSKNKSAKRADVIFSILICDRLVHTRVIGGVLTLDEAIQLGVGRSLLTEDAVSERWRAAIELYNVRHEMWETYFFEKSGGVFFSHCLNLTARFTISAAVAASCCLLALMMSSARSCWAQGSAAARSVPGTRPPRTPQTAPLQAAPI